VKAENLVVNPVRVVRNAMVESSVSAEIQWTGEEWSMSMDRSRTMEADRHGRRGVAASRKTSRLLLSIQILRMYYVRTEWSGCSCLAIDQDLDQEGGEQARNASLRIYVVKSAQEIAAASLVFYPVNFIQSILWESNCFLFNRNYCMNKLLSKYYYKIPVMLLVNYVPCCTSFY
jgi:hypothetical protein